MGAEKLEDRMWNLTCIARTEAVADRLRACLECGVAVRTISMNVLLLPVEDIALLFEDQTFGPIVRGQKGVKEENIEFVARALHSAFTRTDD